MNVFVFDIETIPDVNNGKRMHNIDSKNDKDTADAMFEMQKEKTGNEFLPHYLQKIVAISAVFRFQDKIKVWSLGDINDDEPKIIERFFNGLEKYSPTLVSWNGAGFDLPVLHYRALLHGIAAPRYWDVGEFDSNFKWNNYLNRYHYRHLDLMDVLAAYNGRANAPLDKIASMLNFPGKMGMEGSKVWEYFLEGNLKDIRNYCETDVLNTYLVYLRFQLIRGQLSKEQYNEESNVLREYLGDENKEHFNEFISNWG